MYPSDPFAALCTSTYRRAKELHAGRYILVVYLTQADVCMYFSIAAADHYLVSFFITSNYPH